MTEQEQTDAFEALCGGQHKADRLFRIYQGSYPMHTHQLGVTRAKADVFRRKARREGFTAKQAQALLNLQ